MSESPFPYVENMVNYLFHTTGMNVKCLAQGLGHSELATGENSSKCIIKAVVVHNTVNQLYANKI